MTDSDSLELRYRCRLNWQELTLTDTPGVRHCARCGRAVYWCDSARERLEHVRKGHCIAFAGEHDDAGVQPIQMGSMLEDEPPATVTARDRGEQAPHPGPELDAGDELQLEDD